MRGSRLPPRLNRELLNSLYSLYSSYSLNSLNSSPMLRRFALMEVTVQVPASTTNLGPGFDCLGVALQLWNRTRVRRVDASSRSSFRHPKMVDEAAQAFFSNSTVPPFEFDWSLEGDIPSARGLGSSVTLRLGLLLGLNELGGRHSFKIRNKAAMRSVGRSSG